ncbi:Metacaspase-1 precursor [Auriculariales sp. MPI-PUGE-AT-0066]|nr:Metacaspase-1 precursor [Auriculariales sp. MPI-PUGE-AT-0066]
MWNGQYPPPAGPPYPGAPGYGQPPHPAQSPGFPGLPPGGGVGGFQMPSIPAGFNAPGAGHAAPSPYAPPTGPHPTGFPPPWGAPQASPYGALAGPPPPLGASPYAAPSGPSPASGYPGQYRPSAGPPVATPHHPQPPPRGSAHMPPSQVQHYGPQFQGADHKSRQMYFQYSQCNGKRKALCIGINYTGTSAELRGCHNDARNVQKFLCRRYNYKKEDIVMLLDGVGNSRQQPTRANILAAAQWLVRDAKPNDSLFFHFSGHGGQVKDKDGDEVDGFDETIYPVDFEKAGMIVDDELHRILVQSLPAGCRLTSIFDCCHSGSALDLPYIYSTEGKLKEPNLQKEAAQGVLGAVTSYARGDISGAIKGVTGLFGIATGSNQKATEHARRTKTSPADVISWSGCKDTQTSADTSEAGEATGAMSWAFMESLSRQPQQTYQQLLVSVRYAALSPFGFGLSMWELTHTLFSRSELLRQKYSQKPQLSSSHPMDVNVIFIC